MGDRVMIKTYIHVKEAVPMVFVLGDLLVVMGLFLLEMIHRVVTIIVRKDDTVNGVGKN